MTAQAAAKRVGIFLEPDTDYVLEGTDEVRRRWHNQKYFTWVEQQGKTLAELDMLWAPDFWGEQAAKVAGLDRQTLSLRD